LVEVAVPIIVILLAGAVMLVLTANRRRSSGTGSLSRETRRRDTSTAPAPAPAEPSSPSTEIEAAARTRADDTRSTLGGGVARRQPGEVVEWEPVDEEELGVSRRQFLNRGVLTVTGFSAAALGAGILGFLWPTTSSGGLGDKINAGSLDDILETIAEKREPFYVPNAQTYLRPYPPDALPAAKKVYAPNIYSGMEEGIVALWQRCVHLGCRVPWCQTSQWFECPCHGSKYNAVGEKRDGPAPRGLDRWPVTVEGGDVIIDTALVVQGPPIGTNTTHQSQEGPSCI
jgi:cytochrome b6-f complex iron-sulfur subunit